MTHPQGDHSFTVSRRKFWRALLHEVFVFRDVFHGKPDYRLSELNSLTDHKLAQIKPVVHQDCEIFVDQSHVWSRCKGAATTLKLFPIEQANLLTFNMFNGRYELGEIGERLSQEMGWDQARGFGHVRDLFLSLARLLVCVPSNPLDTDE